MNNELNFINCIGFFDKQRYYEFFLSNSHTEAKIKEIIDKNTYIYNKNLLELFINLHAQSKHTCKDLIEWQFNLRNFLNINEKFSSIEQKLALLILNNPTTLLIPPHHSELNSSFFHYINYNRPNLTFKYNNNNITQIKKHKINIKTPDKNVFFNNFKILRIIYENENNSNASFVLDLKYYGIDTKKLFISLLSIPEFWRNFYYITKTNKTFTFINNSFHDFFVNMENEKPSILLHQITNKNNLIINTSNLANQIIFMNPGLVLPISIDEREITSGEDPNIIVKIKHQHQKQNTHNIHVSSQEIHIKEILEEFSQQFSKREQDFINTHELNSYSGGQFAIHNNNEIIYNYEFNTLHLFSTLTKI